MPQFYLIVSKHIAIVKECLLPQLVLFIEAGTKFPVHPQSLLKFTAVFSQQVFSTLFD